MPLAALVVELTAADAHRLSDALLLSGALSVELADAGHGTPDERPLYDEPGEQDRWSRVQLTALFLADAEAKRGLRDACEACALRAPSYDLRRIDDTDWVRASQSQFQPIQVSHRLWVVPTWHAAPDPDAVNLILDPGMAFGTGGHPTTRLCLRWLADNVKGGESVVDYGCGSGILAIAAMRLGAQRAVGVDIDPEAVAAAEANARRNEVAARFFDAGSAPELSGDVVVANILANPLKMLAPVLAKICEPGGRLAVSGILVAQADEIREIYRPWFELDERAEEEQWVCLSGARR
jgi:ribosomal protein L11 methyltransferase